MTRALLALLALSLAACTHMPVSTIWAMRNFDAATVDPATLRAAITLPEALEPQPGGVTLTVGWWRDGEESAKQEAKLVLKETSASQDVAPLADEKRAGARLFVYRVDPADYAEIRARQKQFLQEKARNPAKTHGSFGVGAEACRRGEFPQGPLFTTSFLRTAPEGAYLTFLKNVDLRAAVTSEKPLDALVPPCEKLTTRAEPTVGAR
jgi:hypothetical protein